MNSFRGSSTLVFRGSNRRLNSTANPTRFVRWSNFTSPGAQAFVASPILMAPQEECHIKPGKADTGRIPHRHTGSDGPRRGETDRFPERRLRRLGKGTVH